LEIACIAMAFCTIIKNVFKVRLIVGAARVTKKLLHSSWILDEF